MPNEESTSLLSSEPDLASRLVAYREQLADEAREAHARISDQ